MSEMHSTFGRSDRPITTEWHSTPRLFVAYFTQEYDGAPDSHYPIGFGKTEEEAVENLREQAANSYRANVKP